MVRSRLIVGSVGWAQERLLIDTGSVPAHGRLSSSGLEKPLMSDWYRTAFGELYPLLYPHRDDPSAAREVGRLIEVLGMTRSGARALDLGCGNGRHAEALSELGLAVSGLDLSPELLGAARQRPPLTGNLIRGDMRRLPFCPVFDLVLSLFTSFGYFADDENLRTLGEMSRVLKPGGRLVIDHINRPAVERNLVPSDTREAPGCRIHQKREIVGERVRKEIVIAWHDGRSTELSEDVRLYSPDQMRDLLSSTGLREVTLFGSFGGAELTVASDRMIAVATR